MSVLINEPTRQDQIKNNFLTPFSPQFHGIQLVVTDLSHHCNSRSTRERRRSRAVRPPKQPSQAALDLDTPPA